MEIWKTAKEASSPKKAKSLKPATERSLSKKKKKLRALVTPRDPAQRFDQSIWRERRFKKRGSY